MRFGLKAPVKVPGRRISYDLPVPAARNRKGANVHFRVLQIGYGLHFQSQGVGRQTLGTLFFSQATGLIRASPGLQSGEAGFQTRENALSCNDRALALVRHG
jgi:hypothetical protein